MTSRSPCTPCWMDNCAKCRGGECTCKAADHYADDEDEAVQLTGCTLCRRFNQPTEPIPGIPGAMRCTDRAACNHARYGHMTSTNASKQPSESSKRQQTPDNAQQTPHDASKHGDHA